MSSSKNQHVHLGQWLATAICGNDILSSSLYVSGIAAIFAGVYAPIVLLVIAGVLFCYKAVYVEVVEALPINGGAYNCLLNGTSKPIAATAGVTTILSYVATAVISATVAIQYINTVLPIPIIPSTIILLAFFALLVISGLKDSAKVAFVIFIFHVLCLTIFLIMGAKMIFSGQHFFWENLTYTTQNLTVNGSMAKQLFLGFAASLLGVSGFESSANFVEEQQKGVFRKTLRNMLIGVAIFNPLIALVALNVAPIGAIASSKDFLLAELARIVGGPVFQYITVADAFLVLSGAVLTSYVGVSGLIYRMAADACLPNFLTAQNKKGTYWKIVLGFLFLCTSILLITKGDILSLAGVYTLAFLSVMSLFAFGNLLLRFSRPELKRTYKAAIPLVITAFLATTAGIIGNILIDQMNVIYFLLYFIPAVAITLTVVYEDYTLRVLLKLTRNVLPPIHSFILRRFKNTIDGTLVVFVNRVDRLYSILRYVNWNEKSRNIILVHCRNNDSRDEDQYEEIKAAIPVMEKAGVFPHLNLTFYYDEEPFGPEAVDHVAKKFRINKNKVLIGSIHAHNSFEYPDLGGARIIF